MSRCAGSRTRLFFDTPYVTEAATVDGEPGAPFNIMFNPEVQAIALRRQADGDLSRTQTGDVGLNNNDLVALGDPWTAKLQEAHELWGRFQAGKVKKPKRETPAAEYQPWPRLSEEQKELICQEYLAGAPVRQIAAQLGCARQTVSQVVAQRGLKRSRSLKGDSLQAQMIELNEQGMTLPEIAAKLCCSRDLLRRRLIKLGSYHPRRREGNSPLRQAKICLTKNSSQQWF